MNEQAPRVLLVVLERDIEPAQARGNMRAFRTYPGVEDVLPAQPGDGDEVAAIMDLIAHCDSYWKVRPIR